jgi:hypothetical protein
VIHTYADVVDNLIDFVGGGPSEQVVRDCRRAAQEAYREMANVQKWPYLYHHGRIVTAAPFPGKDADPEPTMEYRHTGGDYERMMTITDGVWPANASACYVRIADNSENSTNFVAYRIATRVSDTVLTLDPQVNPGGDIPPGALFILYQDTYLLPVDFVSQDEALYELNFGGMQYTHPRDWLYENRYVLAAGVPQFFTITGDPQYPGRLVMRLYPWPQEQRSVDFIYLRRPRPLTIERQTGGTVAIGNGGTTVTVSGATFTPSVAGSVIRISSTVKPPSSAVGSVGGYNPPALEAMVVSYVSPTSVVIDTPSASALSGVGYYITDPIDFEQGAMLEAYLRGAEKCVAKLRTLKDKGNLEMAWQAALNVARAASSPSFAKRHAGPMERYVPRLRDYPQGPDEP